MLIKIMLAAWVFSALSLMAAKYQKDIHGEIGNFTAVFGVFWLSVFLLALVLFLLRMIWL